MPASKNRNPHRGRDYWVCLLTRNGASTIEKTLDSINRQTWSPAGLVAVDDGSTDETHSILESRRTTSPFPLDIITLPDRGYDIVRKEGNIDLAYSSAEEKRTTFSWFMISDDDSVYPENYCAEIIKRMELDPKLVVASGDVIPPLSSYDWTPMGTGRFIRRSFWDESGGYPVCYGSESWLLSKAQQLGYRIANFREIQFQHLRPSGSAHEFKHWGIAMRALGFHPLPVLFRFVSAIQQGWQISFKQWLGIFAEYFLPVAYRNDPYLFIDEGLRQFVREQRFQMLVNNRKLRPFRGLVAALWRVLEKIFLSYY